MDLKGVDFGAHEVIYVTRGEEKPTITEWPNAAIDELLKVLKKHYRSQGNDAKFGYKRILYENCSLALKKKGFKYAAAQCENKWKSLKRRYLTCMNRSHTGKGRKKIPYKRQLYDDEIEYLLQFDKPLFKKELDDTKRNISIRPALEEDLDQPEGNDENGENYMTNDEQLVQRVLRGSDDEDKKDNVFTKNVENLCPPQNKSEASDETLTANNLPLVRDLTKAMMSYVETNTNILKTQSVSYEQILVSLDTLDRKADEKIEIERKMLEQKRIQNGLLAKMVQKLDNITGKGSK